MLILTKIDLYCNINKIYKFICSLKTYITEMETKMKNQAHNYFSLVILKPDFCNLDLFNELLSLFTNKNIEVVAVSSVLMDVDFIKKLYKWEKLLYPVEIKEYLCSENMPIWIVRGNDAIIKTLNIKKALRDKYSQDELHTLLHCPDSHDDFLREYKLLINRNGGKMKTNNQIEVIIFKKDSKAIAKYLMLKRNPQKGGFWQPITGNVEIDETFEEAAIRELSEETGITNFVRIFDTGYSFDFFDDNRNQHEKVFAVEITDETEVVLSIEHTESQWASKEDAISKYLKYPGNITGLKTLAKILENENG